ncbi:hypothetical protein [Nocardioides jiangxiensis]|uniref:Uncharacterized protein n=1 Tax=Nocardioides jiangxiensis TaxID=3064524 RepID=A0ABT9B5C1_9ACTN|nr:hypothetical protein [Nocardioides sp. WY-20]MDO7868501.1 hypothetical protein [Nocardioides sp. WY-20]
MSIQEWLDPEAADEIVADRDALPALSVVEQEAGPVAASRLVRGVKATGRGLLALVLFLVGAAGGFGAGWGYGAGLEKGPHGTDLLPSYAAWPVLWWVLLASIPVALGVGFWKRLRPVAFGYVLVLPWQLALSLGYALHTFGTWGYTS